MIPNIFISSTISDLHHLRDAIRDTIQDIHYMPRMSDYGDLGYLPDLSVEDSCYQSVKECQLFILIIGKTYGSLGKNGFGVTHNEFRTAKQLKIPVICLVDQDVNTYRKVFEANAKKKTKYPGMDNPELTFNMIQEFSTYSENNGYLVYKTMFDARDHIKNQIAHIFCDLLLKRHDTVRGEIKDVLAEITTLRHLLLKDDEEKAKKFVKATRILLDEKFDTLKHFGERVLGGIEKMMPAILKHDDIKSFMKELNIKLKVDSDIEQKNFIKDTMPEGYSQVIWRMLPFQTPQEMASIGNDKNFIDIDYDKKGSGRVVFAFGKLLVWTNENGIKVLDALFKKLKEKLDEPETHVS